nr:immunoglobulin light chain junction region [Macaca mulatta]MOV94956.1 immunoglobulin light chain junction region [Macaca mulatta]MOV95394.1 immunoglobulin light chain junction region [Macaca mulatta]MOV96183.1 immunoglobulin light chain junction region [Macaca mulatta]MOV97374.1 immunoglobulin light chain junction region [Macaca mulatta]
DYYCCSYRSGSTFLF